MKKNIGFALLVLLFISFVVGTYYTDGVNGLISLAMTVLVLGVILLACYLISSE